MVLNAAKSLHASSKHPSHPGAPPGCVARIPEPQNVSVCPRGLGDCAASKTALSTCPVRLGALLCLVLLSLLDLSVESRRCPVGGVGTCSVEDLRREIGIFGAGS